MDFHKFRIRWLLAALAACGTLIQGRISSCDPNPAAFDNDDGLFEVYTFKVEEGILLEPRKLIGSLPLRRNTSVGYKYDEPHFKKPYNLKTNARPAHFHVAFINVSTSIEDNATTTYQPDELSTAQTKQFFASTISTSEFSNDGRINSSESGDLLRDSSLKSYFEGSTQNNIVITSPLLNVTSFPATTRSPSTVKPRAQCGGAQIFQTYGLDREKQDTHYLSINNDVGESELPLLIMIKVTDINDNSPAFVKESLYTQITKDVDVGEIVAHVKATDADAGANADLHYEIFYRSERRGDAEESPNSPTFLIHSKWGLVTLFGNISDLVAPTKVTFQVIVSDRGGKFVANRATASVTVSIIDRTWASTIDPASKSIKGRVVAGLVVGAVLLFGFILFAAFRWRKSRAMRRDAQLQFMMDDENLIST